MGKYKQLLEATLIEAAPAIVATRAIFAKTAKASIKKKSQEAKAAKARDWLVNKSQGAEQRGTSNRVTSGNITTNATSDFNKEREDQINYNITQQGQPPVQDDDKHNEKVTQTGSAISTSKKTANTKRFAAKVKTATKVSDTKTKKPGPVVDRLASVKSSARGVLGSIITNM